jgi:dolichol-phosphate mannosyltransferase
VLLKVTGAFTVPGWTSLVVVTAFLGGIQLIVLGIMGEYVARIHEEVKGRPLYLTYPPGPGGSAGHDVAAVEPPADHPRPVDG